MSAERVGQGGGLVYIHPEGENSMAVCGLAVKSLSGVIAHLTSQGLHAVFKCNLLARAG